MPRQPSGEIPFCDPALGARNLRVLAETFALSATSKSLPRFMSRVETRLRKSPDPDRVLTHFLRFIEASFGTAALFTNLTDYPSSLDLLLGLFGHSQYLADILIREPALFPWLAEGEGLLHPVQPEDLAAEFRDLAGIFSSDERRLDAVKRVHRREYLRISAQDIMRTADLASVTLQLSDLADTVSDAVLQICSHQLTSRSPGKEATPFAVIGLGKVGGQELNYSSDIDVLFVYGSDGEWKDASGRETSHLEYYNLLSSLFIRTMSAPTSEGRLYRVDARLRPEGNAGPLARSVQGYLGYYEARGDLWERQMLLKARPMAGNRELGSAFLGTLGPFVYPRTFLQHPADAIVRMKARIEQKVGDRANVKLRAGGIRDIEFIVQGLQLLNGGKRKELRERNTLRAIALLTGAGLLSSRESGLLSKAYAFYRNLEHRLQLMQNSQTHTLPEDRAKLHSLALRMNMKDSRALQRRLDHYLVAVRALFNKIMTVPAGGGENDIAAVIDGELGEEATAGVFKKYRLRDPHAALRAIRGIAGEGLAGRERFDIRVRSALRDLAPSLFDALAHTPDPDLTLKNVAHLLATHPSPGLMINALRDPHLRALIIDIARVSPWVTRRLASDPFVLEEIIGSPHALRLPSSSHPPLPPNLHIYKQRQEVRSAIRYLLGFASLEELTTELSTLADGIIAEVFDRLLQESGVEIPLAVFAMGKLGTRELMIDADVDLVFIAGENPGGRNAGVEQFAERFLRELGTVSEHGLLYEVDSRLRPEGRSGILTLDIRSYEHYLRIRASFWERQSMTRMRWICGDASVGAQAMSMAARFVYELPLPRDWVGQVSAMRKKMESKIRTSGKAVLDFKRGSGGMVDVEFIVQMIQLRFGARIPEFRSMPLFRLLAADACPVLTAGERKTLAGHYAYFRRTEAMIRLALEGRSAVLPSGPPLETLAQCSAHLDGEEFHSAMLVRMNEVRTLYLSICDRLSGETA
ncbi:MAG: hypothetical protein WB699_10010 [Bacteroidota bacterium]